MSIKFNKPLIGIEWEPQIALKQYPGYIINITPKMASYTSISSINEKSKTIELKISHELTKMLTNNNMYIDVNNMEIFTDPVFPINKLNAEIARRYKILSQFWVIIAKELKQIIGIFLPASNKAPFVTKHVNLSYMIKDDIIACLIKEHAFGKRYNPYSPKITFKDVSSSYHNTRIHITVPYNFIYYKELYKSYIKAYHRDLLWNVLQRGQSIFIDSNIRAYIHNDNNRIETWIFDIKKWLLEYSQDNPMNEPILLGIATPDKFIKKHKLI